jgi:hypothetical protein
MCHSGYKDCFLQTVAALESLLVTAGRQYGAGVTVLRLKRP